MREIVLDTETTGLDPKFGHRIVEIGCVELINHVATQKTYWQYINPERDMPEEAFAVHGLTKKFLSNKPCFGEIVEAFLAFVDDSPLIIHNAEFDVNFLNAELERANHAPLDLGRAIDTLQIARKKFPGATVNLDALCRRFHIENADRAQHGALKDAHLLAEVYLELIGGRQPDLAFTKEQIKIAKNDVKRMQNAYRPRQYSASKEELAEHRQFLEKISEPIWER
ncbi:MAG: DNA polymerase III subunit epsilon [Magnetovibrio sp.]|nr:DNA polymerase III subunit epsilon [Magnetovibrio sp.]